MIEDPQESCYEISPVEGFPEWQHIYDANPHRTKEYLKRELFGDIELFVNMEPNEIGGFNVEVRDGSGKVVAESWTKRETIAWGIWKVEFIALEWITRKVLARPKPPIPVRD